MPTSVRLNSILLAATLTACAAPSIAWAQAAANGERCSGTLCDMYYGSAPPNAAPASQPPNAANAPKGATPLTVPTTMTTPSFLGKIFSNGGDSRQPGTTAAAPDSNSLVKVQGGGLVDRATGTRSSERCDGTLCDLYYGGSRQPEAQPAQQVGASPTPEPAADDTAPAPRRRAVQAEEKPRCVSPPNDPWRCYR